jgi:hypothetical protein
MSRRRLGHHRYPDHSYFRPGDHIPTIQLGRESPQRSTLEILTTIAEAKHKLARLF